MIQRRSDWDARLSEYLVSVRRELNIGPSFPPNDGGDCQRMDIIQSGKSLSPKIRILSNMQNIGFCKLSRRSVSLLQVRKINWSFVPANALLNVADLASRNPIALCQGPLRGSLVGADFANDFPVYNRAPISRPMSGSTMRNLIVRVFLWGGPSKIVQGIVRRVAVSVGGVISWGCRRAMERQTHKPMPRQFVSLAVTRKNIKKITPSAFGPEYLAVHCAHKMATISTLRYSPINRAYPAKIRCFVKPFPSRNGLPLLEACHD